MKQNDAIWPVVRISNAAYRNLDDLKTELNAEGVPVIIDMLLKVYDDNKNDIPITAESLIPVRPNPKKTLDREAAELSLKRNPNYVLVDNSKPSNAIIDAAILFQFSEKGLQDEAKAREKRDEDKKNRIRESLKAIDDPTLPPILPPIESLNIIASSEDHDLDQVSRTSILSNARLQMEKEILGKSWAEEFHSWFSNNRTFTKTIDNRIKSLMGRGILTNRTGEDLSGELTAQQKQWFLSKKEEGIDYRKGVYKLIRVISPDEWTVIEGMLNIPPQRSISIPKIL